MIVVIIESYIVRIKILNDKSLTSWNGLMLKGYTDAYMTFGEEKVAVDFTEIAN